MDLLVSREADVALATHVELAATMDPSADVSSLTQLHQPGRWSHMETRGARHVAALVRCMHESRQDAAYPWLTEKGILGRVGDAKDSSSKVDMLLQEDVG